MLDVIPKFFGLLAACKVRNVGRDESELPRHQRGRHRDPLRRDPNGRAIGIRLKIEPV